MKTHCMLAMAAAVALAAAPCAVARPLTMMTYNVQIGAGLNDPYNFPKGGLGHLPQVAAHIREAVVSTARTSMSLES